MKGLGLPFVLRDFSVFVLEGQLVRVLRVIQIVQEQCIFTYNCTHLHYMDSTHKTQIKLYNDPGNCWLKSHFFCKDYDLFKFRGLY